MIHTFTSRNLLKILNCHRKPRFSGAPLSKIKLDNPKSPFFLCTVHWNCKNHTHFHLQSMLFHLLITERLNCHRQPGFSGAPLSKSKFSISLCPFSCAMYTGVVKRVLVFTSAPFPETIQDFLCALGMKSHMLLEPSLSTLSINFLTIFCQLFNCWL